MTKLNIILNYNNNYKTTAPQHASNLHDACPFPENGHRLSLRIFLFSHLVRLTIDMILIKTLLRLSYQRSCVVLNCSIDV